MKHSLAVRLMTLSSVAAYFAVVASEASARVAWSDFNLKREVDPVRAPLERLAQIRTF